MCIDCHSCSKSFVYNHTGLWQMFAWSQSALWLAHFCGKNHSKKRQKYFLKGGKVSFSLLSKDNSKLCRSTTGPFCKEYSISTRNLGCISWLAKHYQASAWMLSWRYWKMNRGTHTSSAYRKWRNVKCFYTKTCLRNSHWVIHFFETWLSCMRSFDIKFYVPKVVICFYWTCSFLFKPLYFSRMHPILQSAD